MRDFPRNQVEKKGYALVFEDDFDSSELNLDRWLPYYLPQWSSRARSKANYRFEQSQLILQITQDQQPWCREWNGEVKVSNLQTGVYGGPAGSSHGQHRFSEACRVQEEQATQRLFTPQYGYFEMRARIAPNPNNVFGFWMIGFEDQPERSAEICPFEIKGWQVQGDACTLGYGLHPFGDPTIQDEFLEVSYPIDPADYHIYAVDWSEQGVDFYLDNECLHRSVQSPQYPMQLMLNIYEIPAKESGSKSAPVYPAEFTIDYIRCYQRL
ncbi:glycoside hydrolase family 16 protein [Marinicrinis sediminis]|uniref:Glycoside hydrolase family 16 protein n=1 Tax=Marinicrinis sediminis TaxID=1652465 RepID=A0ABW5R9I5_9BACL